MNSSELNELFEQSRDIFPIGSIGSRVFNYIVGCMDSIGTELDGFRLGDVLTQLELKEPAGVHDAALALDALSIGPDALLERRFEYWPEDEVSVLPDVFPISDIDMRDALETGEFFDPRTGAPVPNFKDRISVIYELSRQSRELLERRS